MTILEYKYIYLRFRMIIYNGFSKTPTRTFQAAGIDFFVPNIDDNNINQVNIAKEALKGSYKLTDEQIDKFFATIDDLATEEQKEIIKDNYWNTLHLFYGLKSKDIFMMEKKHASFSKIVDFFLDNYLVKSKDGCIGLRMNFSDMLFINSGIKVALKPYTSLEFKNKSGRGTQGWSVKACLVDEDYAGYMHLSMQYLWYDRDGGGRVYVGDKLTQGTVQEVETDDAVEVNLEKYNEIMANSKRGDNGFGSSDVKH